MALVLSSQFLENNARSPFREYGIWGKMHQTETSGKQLPVFRFRPIGNRPMVIDNRQYPMSNMECPMRSGIYTLWHLYF